MAIQGSLQAVKLTSNRQKSRLKSLFSNHELNNDRMNKRALEIGQPSENHYWGAFGRGSLKSN